MYLKTVRTDSFIKFHRCPQNKGTKKVAFSQKRITSLKNAFFTKLMLHEFFNELEKTPTFMCKMVLVITK